MTEERQETLIAHLTALRAVLLRCLISLVILFPVAYYFTPEVIQWLVRQSFPETMTHLNYFAPMEVFWVQLKLALVLAIMTAYPYIAYQIWGFIRPALYDHESHMASLWLIFASALFYTGVFFCTMVILPLLMDFSASFATDELRPMIGLESFLHLATWLMLAFGVMFQSPIAVMILVRFGIVSIETLRQKRPYVMTLILIIAAVLTPPDIVSQLSLAIPTWLLFELGLVLAGRSQAKG